MITQDRVDLESHPARSRSSGTRTVSSGRPQRRPDPRDIGLAWRLILLAAGAGLALAGWALIMTVFLSFIGLPVFIVGLALIQAQER